MALKKTRFLLGTGKTRYYGTVGIEDEAHTRAFHEAHDDIYKNIGSESNEIYQWCVDNIPSQFEFNQEDSYELNIMWCRIYISLLTDEAAIAFKLRWLQ